MSAPFVCPLCGAVSHNPNDAAKRYCGRCHVFADDAAEADALLDATAKKRGLRGYASGLKAAMGMSASLTATPRR